MATGLPVIGTDVAGTREVIKSSTNGILVPPKEPAAIAEAVQKLMDDTELKNRIAGQGLIFVRKMYSVASNIESYKKLYEG
jgi:glycosyltransferase involved in cell wall biosynthesis